jgi:hypothetical protein
MDEPFNLSPIDHPSPEEQAEIDEAIRESLADLAAGRYRPVEEAMAELCAKYGIPRPCPSKSSSS